MQCVWRRDVDHVDARVCEHGIEFRVGPLGPEFSLECLRLPEVARADADERGVRQQARDRRRTGALCRPFRQFPMRWACSCTASPRWTRTLMRHRRQQIVSAWTLPTSGFGAPSFAPTSSLAAGLTNRSLPQERRKPLAQAPADHGRPVVPVLNDRPGQPIFEQALHRPGDQGRARHEPGVPRRQPCEADAFVGPDACAIVLRLPFSQCVAEGKRPRRGVPPPFATLRSATFCHNDGRGGGEHED